MDPKLKKYLEKEGIEYREHKHPAVFTVEESKKLKLAIPGVHTKNLFLKDDKGRFYLICMPALERLDTKSLRKSLGVGKLHFGSPEELKKELNLEPGSVSIFGMIHAKNVKLLLDKTVWEAEVTGFHPNINTATLEIDHKNLEKFWNSLDCEKETINLEYS
jgi:Ala-tRNA(Pro) deacylase